VNFVSSASFAPAPLLRDAMRHLVSGVCIVTAGLGDDQTGMTVTSATSLSIDPPTMIVCINRSSSVWQRIQRYRHFCINILADHHNEIAERFAGRGGLRGAARYAGANWKILETGAPALDGALAVIDCNFESHGIRTPSSSDQLERERRAAARL
jgi:3-hydroxy-9,10-secoandrosta-1,3,5(10)-triene-9,17-dione monooxygenase reductase component